MKTPRLALVGVSIFTVVSLVLSVAALYSLSRLIQILSGGSWDGMKGTLLIFAGLYGVMKIVSALLNTWRDGRSKQMVVNSFQTAWNKFYPAPITSEKIALRESFYFTVAERFPQRVELDLQACIRITTAITIFSLFIANIWFESFVFGILILFSLALFSYFSTRLLNNSYEESAKRVMLEQSRLTRWIQNFFEGERETRFNWKFNEQPETQKSWYESVGSRTRNILYQHAVLNLRREIFGTLVADWPYILGITSILVCAATGRLSVGGAVLWMGLVDYVVSATQAFRDFLQIRLRIQILDKAILKDYEAFVEPIKAEPEIITSTESISGFAFGLMDGSTVWIPTKPEYVRIQASNGSGKSTLLDVLLGIRTHYERWPKDQVQLFQKVFAVQEGGARVVHSHPKLFDEFRTWSDLVAGPSFYRRESFNADMVLKLSNFLPENLALGWAKRFSVIENRILSRSKLELSSGEKVILSFARAAWTWNKNTKILICDEVDSPLAEEWRNLFSETISYLSQKILVLDVSHQISDDRGVLINSRSLVSNAFVVGVDDNKQGHVIPMRIRVSQNGSGLTTVVGALAEGMHSVVLTVRQAFEHQFGGSFSIANWDICIECDNSNFRVREAQSAGLSVAIALQNIIRALENRSMVNGIACSGRILIDGSVVSVSDIEIKRKAAEDQSYISEFIGPDTITHLYDLPGRLEFLDRQYQRTEIQK